MSDKYLEVIDAQPNMFIVRVPHRVFPAVVIPADALRALLASAEEASDPDTDRSDIHAALADVRDALRARLARYESVMHRLGEPLPYTAPVSRS